MGSDLLRQLCGFQGLFPLLVHRDALDCPVADRECPGDPSLDLDSITPHGAHRPRDDYVLTDLDELLRIDLNGLPTFIEFPPEPLKLLQPIDAVLWTERSVHPLDRG